ncbi:phage late control D family protein [Lonsdalea quercina]|uniref:phage late control D family protein n=1 Tax=Lonsdalea quercina TaxID=71657 RepID=UPI00056605D5|nr:contractile injection system protein, VgrG/Pvc8 family [Lonsdalea quercina]
MATLIAEQAASAANREVPQPIFTLWYLQKDITNDIAPYVTRLTYTDSIKNESDTLDVELDDTEGRWIDAWYPGKGDTLSLKLGYRGDTLRDCGTFSIDEIEVRSPPSTVSMRGVATSVKTALRTKSSRGFEGTTLAAIANRIAKKHKLTLVGSIAPIRFDRITQYAETDVAFLRRLASEYGYAVKVTSTQLIFSHLGALRSQEPVKTLTRNDVASFSVRDTISQVYEGAKIKHQDPAKKQLVTYKADGTQSTDDSATSADTLNVNSRTTDKDTAEVKANAALDQHNEQQESGQLTLMGATSLVAGNKIALSGFGRFSGNWLLNQVRHSLTRDGGYVCELEIVRGPVTKGTRQATSGSSNTLSVYHPDGGTTQTTKKEGAS